MSIRLIALLACMGFVIITIGVGLFCLRQEAEIGNVALSIYDEVYVGVNYAHKSQSEFIRFTKEHDGEHAVKTKQDHDRLGRLVVDLDMAIERSTSYRTRDIAKKIREQLLKIGDQLPGTPMQPAMLEEIDKEMTVLVDRYAADGLIYRTYSSTLVAANRNWLICILSGAVMLAAFIAIILQRMVIPPIIYAAGIAMAIESGKLDNKIETKGHGETTALLEALAKMQTSINHNIERIEEETRRAERERIANQTKSEFLTNMSHELRTPMHAILGFSRQALKRIDATKDEKLAVMVNNIQVSGNRLLLLLNDLLDLAKLEAGKINFKFEKDDIRKTIYQTVQEVDSLAQAKHIQIKIIDDAAPKIITYDSASMAQVFVNLLSNAIKFSPQDSEVTITLSQQRTNPMRLQLLCRVQDQGIGIPESELDLVFDKFVQSSKTKSGAGGTGLGLAIVRQIIDAHHGRIWAENATSKGAAFNILLPYEPEIQLKGDEA